MKKFIILAILAGLPANVLAQDQDKTKEQPASKKEKAKHNHDTYAKAGLVHWEGQIEGLAFNLNGLSVDVETYFNASHLQLSGWSIGYRKDDLRYSDSGHLLNFKVFRTVDLKVADAKFGVGAEWGMPAFGLDRSEFREAHGEIYYRHIYPDRNSNAPYIGTATDGILYPFADASLLKRKWVFLVEAGVRINFIRYGVDGYTVRNDTVRYDLRNRRIPMPTPFVSVGIKLQ